MTIMENRPVADSAAEMQQLWGALIQLRKGDAGVRLPLHWSGVAGRVADAFNDVVEQNANMAEELSRLRQMVGKEGKLEQRASLREARGFWGESIDCINALIDDLVHPTSEVARVIGAVAQGDLSKSMALEVEGRPLEGEFLRTAKTINKMVDQLGNFSAEVTRVAREVGTEGELGGQAKVKGVAGTWKDLTDSVNSMAGNLTDQVRNIADVTKAVAAGDLSKKITVDVKGEILELKATINTMVDQLSSFAAEVTRVAREVGTEGRLGGQADVQGVSGTWKDLTDNVNFMAGNLTSQVRGIAKVVTAVADGDLNRKLSVEAKGEIAALADTINGMTETLATFADQVTTVAREVGVEGKLGGQAKVPGASGTWKALTENVNELAANLTTQVRAIAEVATAVTQGDLTRSITVETQGEVASLKDTINEMIRNLKDTTQKNTEQDWLKTNLAKFSRMLQGQKELVTVGHLILSELAPVVGAQQAEFYVLHAASESPRLRLFASYASGGQATHGKEVQLGEGLVGQCAVDKRKLLLTNVPSGAFRVASGLSESAAMDVLVLPIVFEGQLRGVLELASLERFNPVHEAFLDQLTESIGIVINTIEANTRTEDLLKQSQSLAEELGSRQEELQQTNQELQDKARLLAHQNHEVERKNSEVEQARQALEEKAEQLALTSKYKSEFLANMSHELRTPLNSLLILSDQLCKNPDGNLSAKQVEFSKTIHSSGNDLLMLINDILDLSKIESGTVAVDASELRVDDLHRSVERGFRHFAESKHVDFAVELKHPLPKTMVTDVKRLQQIIKNLLSNAFKFTHEGQVTFSIATATNGWSVDNDELHRAGTVLAFSVRDTGIGISPDKQQIIFEAFQQADGSTSRKYGGTGLGLAISRELSRLLGGEIRLVSSPGKGSEFTLYLPQSYNPARLGRHPRATLALPVAGMADVSARARGAQIGVADAALVDWRYAEDDKQSSDAVAFANAADDDRANIATGDRVLLIVENDLAFARVLLAGARAAGFKGLVTRTGASALTMVREFHPAVITLDIHLPDMPGWRILNRLKGDLVTRHIPICVVSTDDARDRALQSGALGFLGKPLQSADDANAAIGQLHAWVECGTKRLAVVMPPSPRRSAFIATLDTHVDVVLAEDRESARHALAGADALVVEDTLVDFGPEDVLDAIAERRGIAHMPVVLYHGGAAETGNWNQRRAGLTIAEAASLPELRMQTALWLHRSPAALSDEDRDSIEALIANRDALKGRKALIVDDDMRNIFALATVLDEEGMVILSADNGREAIRLVQEDPTIDIVLMDIMMPEMDGIATMQEIRKLPRGRELPMVAVTAKAMKGDRQKCIEAGAWDYISKPVDPRHLVSVLRGWLCR
jgi:signal transduction histidine kinase/DNA-binding response OmpR family regulator/HAMP domain-containing protein